MLYTLLLARSLLRYRDGLYAHSPEVLPRAGGSRGADGGGAITFTWGGRMRGCALWQFDERVSL